MIKMKGYQGEVVGKGKKSGEDVAFSNEALGLYIVCDGSTNASGRWAAETTCAKIDAMITKNKKYIEEYNSTPTDSRLEKIEELIDAAIKYAANFVYEKKRADLKKAGCLATVDVVLLLSDSFIVGHAGSGRVYLLRDGKALCLTEDDTTYAEMLKKGFKSGDIDQKLKKDLRKAIGFHRTIDPKVESRILLPGDMIILCTDGFHEVVPEDPSEGADLFVNALSSALVPNTMDKLAAHAAKMGSTDDSTILLLRDEGSSVSKEQLNAFKKDYHKQVELIKKIPAFKEFVNDPARLSQLHRLFRRATFNPGEPIVTQGDPSFECFIIVKGRANVLIDGQSIEHPRVEGAMIGEMGVFTGQPRSATVIATTEMELISISKQSLEVVINKDKEFGLKVYRGVIEELVRKMAEKDR